MKAAWDACKLAGVPIPKEITDFFGDEDPDPAGVVHDLENIVRESSPESENRFEIDLDQLPPHVKTIRFVNSY
jgi:hypothetical protein